MGELKPCPFCGSNHLGISDKTTTISYKRKRHVAVYCKDCNCYGARIIGEEQSYNSATDEAKSKAIVAWNQRAELENLVSVEEMEQEGRAGYVSGYADGIKDGQAKPENKPLTLEQLMQADGEPVWIVPITDETKLYLFPKQQDGFWDICLSNKGHDAGTMNFGIQSWQKANYGKTWLAYAHKPEQN